jgi:hypothetical protein
MKISVELTTAMIECQLSRLDNLELHNYIHNSKNYLLWRSNRIKIENARNQFAKYQKRLNNREVISLYVPSTLCSNLLGI